MLLILSSADKMKVNLFLNCYALKFYINILNCKAQNQEIISQI